MKDYAKENTALKSEIRILNQQMKWYQEEIERRSDRDSSVRDKFRDLLIETLEKQ